MARVIVLSVGSKGIEGSLRNAGRLQGMLGSFFGPLTLRHILRSLSSMEMVGEAVGLHNLAVPNSFARSQKTRLTAFLN
jgi:hypothetical protein